MSTARYVELVGVKAADAGPPRSGPEEAEVPTAWDPSLCTVQFSAPIFYADQAEGDMRIDVIRRRASDTRAAAKYSTKDVSAKAEETYRAVSGEVVFEPGETLKTIVVPLIRSGIWSATVEYNVVLSEPSSCNLDRYLYECRVKVIDDNVFPSNKFRQELTSGKRVRGIYLFWEYVKWNLRSAKLLLPCLVVIGLDQLNNANKILLLCCNMYFVNVVCDPEVAEESLLLPSYQQTAYLITAAHIAPLLVLYLAGLVKTRLDITGYSTLHLQQSVYRKFMNLSQASSSGVLDLRMSRDCVKLASGFAASLGFIDVLVNVGMNVVFILKENSRAAPFALSVPAVIVAWALFRYICFDRIGTSTHVGNMKDYVNETHRKSELVRTFFLRPQMNAGLVRLAKDLEAEGIRKAGREWTTQAGLHAIAPICVGVYISAQVDGVLTGEIKIGTVLATIGVMKNISDLTLTAHSAVIDMVKSFPALEHLVEFLNLETELQECKTENRLKRGYSARHAEFALVCHDAAFSYEDGAEILANLNITAAQGKIIEVRGEHHSGKYTFMCLLGQTIRATRGYCFAMSHFRTLFVPWDVQFFDRSLMHNLTVGCPGFCREDVPRLKSILRDLRLEKVLSILDDELASDAKMFGKDTWSEALTRTDLYMLSLARALVMNPEVLVIANVFAGLSQSRAKDVAAALVAQVANRGLHLPAEDASHRHPRTVFYSTEDRHPHSCMDVVWVMTQSGELNSRGNPIWTVREDFS